MEPTTNIGGSSGEMGPQRHAELPAAPDGVAKHVEQEKSGSQEVREQGSAGPANGGPVPAQAALPQLPVVPVTAPSSNVPQADDTPLVASDDEVMEREWVEKAKKIVAQTKTDPFSQEKEVSKLQADYIKKRYGKEIKLTSD